MAEKNFKARANTLAELHDRRRTIEMAERRTYDYAVEIIPLGGDRIDIRFKREGVWFTEIRNYVLVPGENATFILEEEPRWSLQGTSIDKDFKASEAREVRLRETLRVALTHEGTLNFALADCEEREVKQRDALTYLYVGHCEDAIDGKAELLPFDDWIADTAAKRRSFLKDGEGT